MKKKVILTDVDGVLLIWQSMLPFFAVKYNIDLEKILEIQYTEEFKHTKELFNCCSELAQKLKKEYHSSEYIKMLTGYTDAIKVVNELKKEYEFIAITALEKSDEVLKNRTQNLNILFPGAFSQVILTENSKESAFRSVLAKLVDEGKEVICYVDDLISHLDTFEKVSKEYVKFNILKKEPILFHMLRGSRIGVHESNTVQVNHWNDIKRVLKRYE